MNGKYRPWNREDIDRLKELVDKGADIKFIQKKLDRSSLSIMNQIQKMDKPDLSKLSVVLEEETPKSKRTTIEKAAINFIDMKVKDKDYTDVWTSILDFQQVLEEKSIEQSEAEIHIKTKKWIGVAFAGDLHIGNMATDYKTMLKHRDLIAKTDDLYLALNGDYCDNYLPTSHAAGMFEALFPPAVQKNLAKDYIQSLQDKVLSLVAGCHDAWGLKASDWDLTEYLAKHGEAVYLGNGGTLWLTVGKTQYKIMMRHKYRYNSQDNPTATVKKMFEKSGGFDVGVVSHHHVASMEEATKEGLDGNLKRIFLRAGTYKTNDRWGNQQGYSEGITTVPVVLFNPKERDIRGFQCLQEGIEYLAYLNKR